MIQIYTDGVLAYDSRLKEAGKDYTLLGLKVTTGLNKGGTATIIMPPGHPAYEAYTSYRTVVEIYRDDVLLFRGRVLYPADDFYNRRTVTCEGELCFFQDGVSRPYVYQESPAAVFSAVVAAYNAQVEAFKRFRVGEVTVTDDNDYILLESETAESCMDTINKLLERCGGYIVFTTDPDDGVRVVNWYASLESQSGQVIEFGSNLLSFSRTGANTDLLTAVLPYGAKDDKTGERLTIKSVNNGVDFIQDDEAVALRGRIMKSVTWDDVTQPTNLLNKARKYLRENRQIVTSLELTAVDLSYLDKNIDGYRVGDTIRVKSKPHAVDDYFQLTERTEDLLDPSQGSITLGKDIRTLTGADVAGDHQNKTDLQKTQQNIKKDYTLNTEQAVAQLVSLIEQKPGSIKLEVTNGKPGQKAAITLTVDGATQTGEIDLTGAVTFTNLRTSGQTQIHGANITTGKIDADRIDTDALFAKDINMTGQFESTAQGYLPMTEDDYYTARYYTMWPDQIPAGQEALYDFNCDGVVNSSDMLKLYDLYENGFDVSGWAGAVKSTITIRINMSDPEKTIHIFGTNMWGSYVESFIGADVFNCSFVSKKYMDDIMTYPPLNGPGYLYRPTATGERLFYHPPMFEDTEYATVETWNGRTVYKKCIRVDALPNSGKLTISTGVSASQIVRIEGTAYSPSGGASHFPLINSLGQTMGVVWALNRGTLEVFTFLDCSSYSADFVISYIKD